jgi:hypothetical protein
MAGIHLPFDNNWQPWRGLCCPGTRTEKLDIRECKDRLSVANCVFIGGAATRFVELGLGKQVTKKQTIKYIDEVLE